MRNEREKANIINAVRDVALPWLGVPMDFPGASILELSRLTGIQPKDVKADLAEPMIMTINGTAYQIVNDVSAKRGPNPLSITIEPALSERERRKQRVTKRWEDRFNSTEQYPLDALFSYLLESAEKDGLVKVKEMRDSLQRNVEIGNAQFLLSVWGPPYENQSDQQNLFGSNEPEGKLVNSLMQIWQDFLKFGIAIQPVILYADTYGVDINFIPQEIVERYGERIAQKFSDSALFITWSRVKFENALRYQEIKNELLSQGLSLEQKEIDQAVKMANKLGRNLTGQEAKNAAIKYRLERLIEGKMLTEGFKWNDQQIFDIIKIGTAPSRKRNDDPYEPCLPRIYLKNMIRAPWNKRRSL